MKKSSAKKDNKIKVFVAMSGGVDSSVAPFLLKHEGYDVTGVFMRCYNLDGCAERDAEDARRVAQKIGIPFYIFDFEREYKKRVVEYMIEGYRTGITPNPDVMCNKEIKFGLFLKRALSLGADYVATGHYVRLSRTAFRKQHNFLPARKFASLSPRHPSLRSRTKLSRLRDVPQDSPASPAVSLSIAKDKNKDQSYFLWTLTQEQLRHCLFPIGDYLKSEVRAIAKQAELATAEKKDSQGICFLGDISLFDFLKKKIKTKRGAIVTTDGVTIGQHEGAWFYTIGQRHGLNLQEKNKALNIHGNIKTLPHYVAAKNVKTNTVVMAEGEDNPALFKKEVGLADVLLLPELDTLISANSSMDVQARVRYRQPLARAILYKVPAPFGKLRVKLVFEKFQKFVAPGQSSVIYSKQGAVLGGGIILP